jgi:hypothetical protein
VAAICAALGLGAERRASVKRRYQDLELGVIDARPVDRRVLDAVAAALGMLRRDLVTGPGPPSPAAPAALLRRSWEPPPREFASVAAAAVEGDSDPEVDRLFGLGP